MLVRELGVRNCEFLTDVKTWYGRGTAKEMVDKDMLHYECGSDVRV